MEDYHTDLNEFELTETPIIFEDKNEIKSQKSSAKAYITLKRVNKKRDRK